jgi:hypothetical protein
MHLHVWEQIRQCSAAVWSMNRIIWIRNFLKSRIGNSLFSSSRASSLSSSLRDMHHAREIVPPFSSRYYPSPSAQGSRILDHTLSAKLQDYPVLWWFMHLPHQNRRPSRFCMVHGLTTKKRDRHMFKWLNMPTTTMIHLYSKNNPNPVLSPDFLPLHRGHIFSLQHF